VIVIGNNWTKFSVGWFAGPYKEGCWPWRLALFGEDSFLLFSYPIGIFLGGWFSILKICSAFYKKRIISLGFSFWVVLVKYFQVETRIVSLKFGDI
jgi:hypothetical protein